MDRKLQAAFRNTLYKVAVPHGELILRVDRPVPGLVHLLRESGASCAALLTAFNPGGRRSTRFRNLRAHRGLHDALLLAGCRVLTGHNIDPRGRWPTEPSWLALGLGLTRARRLAVRHGQAAFLWTGPDGVPRLVESSARLPYRRQL